MTVLLKQSTAVTVKLGPFVDETDGKTAETALTISQADIRLSKNGGAFAQTNNAAGATHDAAGWYGIPLDTTDTGTLGVLAVSIHESGALPVWEKFMILPAMVYDSLVSGSDKLEVDPVQWNGTNVAAPATAGYPAVTLKVGTGTGEVNLASGKTPATLATADVSGNLPANVTQWSGTNVAAVDTAGYPKVTVKSGTGAGEINLTSGIANANVFQISGDAVAADNLEKAYDGTGYNVGAGQIVAASVTGAVGSLGTGTPPTAAQVRAEIDSNSTKLAAIETDTQDIQSRLPATLSSGRMRSDAEAISASTAAADAVESNIGNLDAAVSTRSSHAASDVTGGTTVAGAVTALSAAAHLNKAADHVIRRNMDNVQASSNGDTLDKSSLYGAIQTQQYLLIEDGVATIKNPDGTTLGTLAIVTSSSANPIVGVS